MSVMYKQKRSPRQQLVTSIILPQYQQQPRQQLRQSQLYTNKIKYKNNSQRQEQQYPDDQQQPQSPKNLSPNIPSRSLSPKKQQPESPRVPIGFEQASKPSPKKMTNIEPLLYPQLKKAQKATTYTQKQIIQHYLNLIENKVHDIETGQDQQVTLKNIYKNSVGDNVFIENGIQGIVSKATQNAINKINPNKSLTSKRQVPLTKDDLRELQKVDKYRLLKIKNGEIKSKVGDLRNKLQQQYYQKKANFKLPDYENVKESDYYSIDNPKTLEAGQFVNRIRKQRQEERMRYAEYLEKKREEEKLRRSLDLKRKQEQAMEKRNRLEEIYKLKQQKKIQQEAQHLRKKQNIAQWSKIFNKQKPLFIKKQQQFINNELIPSIVHRRQILNNIKQEHRPINHQQLNQHDQRYMQYKKDDAIRNQAQLQMQRQQLQQFHNQQEQYYKGKYRYLALEAMMEQKQKNNFDVRDIQREKKARQIVYADEIKEKVLEQFRDREIKNLQLGKKQFSRRKRNMDGSVTAIGNQDQSKMTSYTDPKVQGKRNLHFLHELVKEKGIKKDRPHIKLLQQKHVYPDYLQELHHKRQQQQQNIRNSSLHAQDELYEERNRAGQNIDSLIAKQKRLREKVKRDSVRRKHNSLDYKEDLQVEDNQIEAIRLKMRLMRELK